MTMKRRDFLLGGLAGLGGLSATRARADDHGAPTGEAPMSLGERIAAETAAGPCANATLSLYHIHTAESLKVTYRDQGRIVPDALAELDHLLRDFRTNEAIPIDVDLLDTLTLVYDRFGCRGRYEIISGYRSPRTNSALRHVTTGVAENSHHMYGRAVDVRLVGTETDVLRDAAIDLARGGVGYYPDSNFVHLDTGRVRRW